ncbi:MAG: SGNH/GDSL hydrolase family protein, partial [Lachnospiraceae bacterium]|nr:SGNH/GDSL hydrolase family protein [Lachnospiraceae bacterium]
MIVSVFAAFCLGLLAGVILREYVPVTGYCRAFFYIKRGKRAYPVLPFVSIKYAFLLLAILFLVLVIIEYSQPHYDEWRVERALRERLHADITGHMLEKYEAPGEYPLWQREGYEVEITGTEKNILVLGDSFVHQYSHADANQLWWKQLDKVLKQRGYHDVNVYAVGVEGGAATYDHMRWLRDTDMVRDLQPDLIIMGYVTNDTDRYNGWSRDEIIKTYWEPDVFDKYNTLHAFKTVFPNFAYLINDMVQKKKPPTNYNDEIGYPMEIQELELVSGERLANYNRYAVAPLGETLAKLDIPAFLVTSPRHLDAAYYEPLYAPVLPLFEKAGITTYNLLYDM